MKISEITLSKSLVGGILALWTIVVLMVCNIDSYLYAQCGQFDSAVFFMCGKAMMNGLVPYTDFTDSKGVLLWFIYGLGYLWDHYSYVGVFWLACLNVWATLQIAYRTARLWFNEKTALLAASLLIIPLTYWNFYTETKAEHFCWPAVAWGIYVLLRGENHLTIHFKHGLWLGVGLVACLMLKWSVALMMLSLILSVGWMAWRSKTLSQYTTSLVCGIFLSFTPFAIAFTCWGNWVDMWQEYFVNTLSSVSVPMSETLTVYSQEWAGMFTTRRFLYLLYTLPILTLWNRKDWFASALPVLCGLFFIALGIRHDGFGHYISVVGPFAILSIVVVLRYLQKINWLRLRYIAPLGLLATLYVMWGSIRYTDSFCTKAGEKFDKYMAVSAAMSQVPQPKVIVVGQERGVCMATSLPGTRYWITQLGRTEQMWQEQTSAIDQREADFVIMFGADSDDIHQRFIKAGYHFFDDFYGGKVYTFHSGIHPIAPKTLTAWDIITKRTYEKVYCRQIELLDKP